MDRNDADYYQFRLATAGKVTLNFKHPYRATAYGQWSVSLYTSGGSLIYSMDVDGFTTSKSMTPLGLPAGSYYVKIRGYQYSFWSSATYNFAVASSSTSVWETEFNDAMGTADHINLSTRYYGNIMDRNDADYYWFNRSSSGRITINFQHPYRATAYGQWIVSLYDQKGNLVNSMDVGGMATNKNMVANISAGAYYVKVRGYQYSYWSSATYNLRVS